MYCYDEYVFLGENHHPVTPVEVGVGCFIGSFFSSLKQFRRFPQRANIRYGGRYRYRPGPGEILGRYGFVRQDTR